MSSLPTDNKTQGKFQHNRIVNISPKASTFPEDSNSIAEIVSQSFLESKLYFIVAVIIGLFYFLDVFVGMFMIYREYSNDGYFIFENNERNYGLEHRPYDVIEVILLGVMLIEGVVKLAFTTRYTRKVRACFHFGIIC